MLTSPKYQKCLYLNILLLSQISCSDVVSKLSCIISGLGKKTKTKSTDLLEPLTMVGSDNTCDSLCHSRRKTTIVPGKMNGYKGHCISIDFPGHADMLCFPTF